MNTDNSTDGTTHACDILIGADGVRSTVRKMILSKGDPAATPQNSGWWVVWGLKPYSEAQTYLEINNTCQQAYFGDGTFFMHSILDGGQTVSFALTCHDDEVPEDQYTRPVSADEIRRLFRDWSPDLLKAIEEASTEFRPLRRRSSIGADPLADGLRQA